MIIIIIIIINIIIFIIIIIIRFFNIIYNEKAHNMYSFGIYFIDMVTT